MPGLCVLCPKSKNGDLSEVTKKKLSFHKLPHDESRKKEWIKVIRSVLGESWTPRSKLLFLCSDHFLIYDFIPNGIFFRLKGDAVPTQRLRVNYDRYLFKTRNRRQPASNDGHCLTPLIQMPVIESVCSIINDPGHFLTPQVVPMEEFILSDSIPSQVKHIEEITLDNSISSKIKPVQEIVLLDPEPAVNKRNKSETKPAVFYPQLASSNKSNPALDLHIPHEAPKNNLSNSSSVVVSTVATSTAYQLQQPELPSVQETVQKQTISEDQAYWEDITFDWQPHFMDVSAKRPSSLLVHYKQQRSSSKSERCRKNKPVKSKFKKVAESTEL